MNRLSYNTGRTIVKQKQVQKNFFRKAGIHVIHADKSHTKRDSHEYLDILFIFKCAQWLD